MCIAIPGKVLEVDGSTAKVDFQGNLVDVTLGLVDAKPGQYVLVHAGCAIQVMEKEQADEIADLERPTSVIVLKAGDRDENVLAFCHAKHSFLL